MLTKQHLDRIEKSVKEMMESETKSSLIGFYKYSGTNKNFQINRHTIKSRRRLYANRRKPIVRKVFRKFKIKTQHEQHRLQR